MGRRRQRASLRVLLNHRQVGHLMKEAGGSISFRYDESWLGGENPFPVSLSLPLREDPYRGAPVVAVFENLLPDSEGLRRRVAEKVGALGTDAYSLLEQIGRDCVGALQFVAEIGADADVAIPAIGGDGSETGARGISGEVVSDEEIEQLLKNLKQAPLGLDRDQDFRISVAGAQEKTALLLYEGRWWKPHGTTPTTHLFKPQIGTLPNGIDLTNSVENEYYCLKLMAAFGLPVNTAEMRVFGKTKALVIERFDRRWASDGRLLRLPQEDCCQALSVPPGRKYQSEGGPGMVDILRLLGGADASTDDQRMFLKAQILYWLIGATDGHAKNFSVHLGPRGRFRLTPLYDVLTAQPSLDAHHIHKKQMKLAMSAGDSRHYTMHYIHGRHFVQTAERAGRSANFAWEILREVADTAEAVLETVAREIPRGPCRQIHASVREGMGERLKHLLK